MFDVKQIKKNSKTNFEETWVKSNELLPKNTKIKIKKKGNPHPIEELKEKFRKILLEMGFDEIENRHIINEDDVYKQYGPEAPVILDRCYYLAVLPRPEIGLSDEKIEIIKKIDPNFNKTDELMQILRKYKIGEIEGDDFVETLVVNIGWSNEQTTKIMEEAFPELKNITPIPTQQTLRSHMTGAWFETLEAIQNRYEMPIALFSIGPRYRREQKEDASHLRVHHGASLVIMDEKMSLEAGYEITKEILEKLGFTGVEFVVKKATSKYYAPGSEAEVFCKLGDKKLEIGDVGMYSPIALANYDIKYPVFNAGFGIERVALVLNNKKDVRELVYPHFYSHTEMNDQEIAEKINIEKTPKTSEGQLLAKDIYEKALKNKEAETPCEINVFSGKLLGKNVSIKLFKDEAGKKLLGPATLNKIFVYNGEIIAFDPEKFIKLKEVAEKGIKIDFDFLEAISNLFAYEIEEKIKEGVEFEKIVEMVKSYHDVNVSIPEKVVAFISSKNKKIDFRGPVFLGVRLKIN